VRRAPVRDTAITQDKMSINHAKTNRANNITIQPARLSNPINSNKNQINTNCNTQGSNMPSNSNGGWQTKEIRLKM